MNTKRSLECVKAGEQSESDPLEFIMSSDRADRIGDVIEQSGWNLTSFRKNPVALFGHEHSFPIGTWKNVRVEGNKLIGRLSLAAAGTSERIDEVRSLLEQRILKAVSVGFRILDYEPMDEKEPWGAWRIKKSELLETSVVSVPANPDAVAVAKSLGISKETQRLIFAAGQTPTPQDLRTRHKADANSGYSDLIGPSSDVIRARRDLERRGLI